MRFIVVATTAIVRWWSFFRFLLFLLLLETHMLLATRLAHALMIVVFCFATVGCGGPTKPTDVEGIPDIPAGERSTPSGDAGEGNESGAVQDPPPE